MKCSNIFEHVVAVVEFIGKMFYLEQITERDASDGGLFVPYGLDSLG